MAQFKVICLDDEKSDVVKTQIKQNLGKYVKIFATKTIKGCCACYKVDASEYLFLLDCNLEQTEGEHASFGGYATWSEIINKSESRQPFVAIYTGAQLAFVEAIKYRKAKQKLVPPLFNWESDKNTIWEACKEWIRIRQHHLIELIDHETRIDLVKQLRGKLEKGCDIKGILKFIKDYELRIIDGDSTSCWSLSALFPVEMHEAEMKKELLSCYKMVEKLKSRLSDVWHDFACFLNTNPKSFTHPTFINLHSLKDKIHHLIIEFNEKKSECSFEASWQPIVNYFDTLKTRQEHALEGLPDTLKATVTSDSVYNVIISSAEAKSAEQLATALHQVCRASNLEINLPIAPKIMDSILQCININAIKHGWKKNAKTLIDKKLSDGAYWYCFQTDDSCERDFNSIAIKKKIENSLLQPESTKLTGLIEWVCNQYGGEIYIVQRVKTKKASEPDIKYLHFTAGNIQIGSCAEFPDNINVDSKFPKVGTFYFLSFPEWKDSSL